MLLYVLLHAEKINLKSGKIMNLYIVFNRDICAAVTQYTVEWDHPVLQSSWNIQYYNPVGTSSTSVQWEHPVPQSSGNIQYPSPMRTSSTTVQLEHSVQ